MRDSLSGTRGLSLVLRGVVLAVLMTGLFGCSSSRHTTQMLLTELGMLSQRRGLREAQRPVIIVPGYLGTRLKSKLSNKPVWGHFGFSGVFWTGVSHLRDMAFPMEPGVALNSLKDNLAPDGVVRGVLFAYVPFLPIRYQVYIGIINQLERLGYCYACQPQDRSPAGSPARKIYIFEYDWRQSNDLSASGLARFVDEIKKEIVHESHSESQGIDFDMICHSNGCLVARYFLRYGSQPLPSDGDAPQLDWRGAEGIRNLVMLAPANAGTIKSVLRVKRGFRYFNFGYPPAVVGTFPSIYQLFPRKRHRLLMGENDQIIDPLDSAFWEQSKWGPFDPGEDHALSVLLPDAGSRKRRLAILREHVQKCMAHARRFQDALDRPSSPPKPLRLWLFLGKDQPTPSMYKQNEEGRWVLKKELLGDGSVVAFSALMDESAGGLFPNVFPRTPIDWSGVMTIFAKHFDISSNDEFVTNLSFILDHQDLLGGLR